ncbi:hypothetical protein ACQ3I4_05190 [Zafaria sp. Z1313]|uniref:WXG100-like domain-containing protein n=1 Tax=Zafaria sp. Z1313 TaxID=3423202 RepID=UPI003D301F71
MTAVVIDTGALFASARTTGVLAQQVETIAASLGPALSGSAGMAGGDETGREFGTAYDAAANGILEGLRSHALHFETLGRIQHIAGAVYEAVEAANAGLDAPAVPAAPGGTAAHCPPGPPSAVGGTWAGADELQWLLDAVGVGWPQASAPSLRSAAAAWSATAARIDTAAITFPTDAARLLSGCSSRDTSLVIAALHHGAGQLGAVAQGCRDAAAVCDEFAAEVDAAHAQLRTELLNAALMVGVVGLAGAALTPVTFGGGALAGSALNAGRLATLGAVLRGIVGRLAGVGAQLASRLGPVGEAVRGAVSALGAATAPLGGAATRFAGHVAAGTTGIRAIDVGSRAVTSFAATRTGKALGYGAGLARDVVADGVVATVASRGGGKLAEGAVTRWRAAGRDPAVRAAAGRGGLLVPPGAALAATALTVHKRLGAVENTVDLLPGRRYADQAGTPRAPGHAGRLERLQSVEQRANASGRWAAQPVRPGASAAALGAPNVLHTGTGSAARIPAPRPAPPVKPAPPPVEAATPRPSPEPPQDSDNEGR